MPSPAPLRTIKTIHTVVWAFFVACIVGILGSEVTGRMAARSR